MSDPTGYHNQFTDHLNRHRAFLRNGYQWDGDEFLEHLRKHIDNLSRQDQADLQGALRLPGVVVTPDGARSLDPRTGQAQADTLGAGTRQPLAAALAQTIGGRQRTPFQEGPSELLGQAAAWGIQNPEQLTEEQLAAEVERRRGLAPENPLSRNPTDPLAGMIAGALFGVGHGVAESAGEVVDQLRRVPGLPESFLDAADKWLGQEKSREWLGKLQENYRSRLSEAGQAVFDANLGVGYVAGMVPMAALVWRATGVGPLGRPAGSLLGTLGRAGARGAGTAMILDAGEDMPWLPDAGDLENAGLRTPDQRDALARSLLGNRAGRALTGAFVDAGIEGGIHLLRRSRATAAPSRVPNSSRTDVDGGQRLEDIPYADYEVLPDSPGLPGPAPRGPTSPFSPVQRRLGAGDPPGAGMPDAAPTSPTGPLSGPDGGAVPPTQPGRVYHIGDYAGGAGNPQASITGSAGTYGQGLYFGKNRTALAEMVPGQQHGWGGQLREFDISGAKLARMDEPLTPDLFERIVAETDPEYAGDWQEWYVTRIVQGEQPTLGDWYFRGAEDPDAMWQDGANAILASLGYDGVEDEQEVNIFPGREAQVVKLVTPEGAPASPMRSMAQSPSPQPQGTTLTHTYPDERSLLFRIETTTQPQAEPSWWESALPQVPPVTRYRASIERELVPLREEEAMVMQRLTELEQGTPDWVTQEYVDVEDAREGTMRHLLYVQEKMKELGAGNEVRPEDEQALVDFAFKEQDLSQFRPSQITSARTELMNYGMERSRATAMRSTDPARADAVMRNADDMLAAAKQLNPAISVIQEMDEKLPGLRERAGLAPRDGLADLAERRAMRMRTPARALVHQAGTLVRDETGLPKLLHHGTSVEYDEFDISETAEGGLTGPGIYFADNANPSGMEPLDVEPERGLNQEYGYAYTRAAEREGDRRMLLTQIETNRRHLQEAQDYIAANKPKGIDTGFMEMNARLYASNIERFQEKLERTPEPAPNMRPAYILSKQMLRADDPMNHELRTTLLDALANQVDQMTDSLSANTIAEIKAQVHEGKVMGVITGEPVDPMALANQVWSLETPMGWIRFVKSRLGGKYVRKILRDLGYDTVHNKGGIRSNSKRKIYEAYNVLDETIIVPAFAEEPWVAERAKSLGVQLGKQAQVIQSEAFPDVTAASEVTDSDVVKAALARNPAGVSLVKGISDPALLLSHAIEGYLNWNGVQAKHWRMVEREGRIDLLVSSMNEVTDEMVDTYARYGVFPGQEVMNVNSKKVRILSTVWEEGGKTYASTYDPTKGMKKRRDGSIGYFTVKERLENIAPTYYAPQMLEAPGLWSDFVGYAEAKLVALHQEVGVAAEEGPLFLTSMGRERLPRIFEEFADSRGMIDPAQRVALRSYFDIQLVATYRDLLPPEDAVMLDAIRSDLDALVSKKEPELASIHSLAEARGFRVVPIEGSAELSLEDTMSAEKFRMADEESARGFLMEYSRDLHDGDPGGPAPVELADLAPDGSVVDYPSEAEAVEDALAELEELAEDAAYEAAEEAAAEASGAIPLAVVRYALPPAGSGGAAIPIPTAPRPGAGGTASGGAPPAGGAAPPAGGPPPRRPGRASARRGDTGGGPPNLGNVAQHWGDVSRLLHSTQANYLWPIRTTFAELEQVLSDVGAPNLRPWRDYEIISRNLDVAHNEAYNYHRDLTSASAYINSVNLRRGNAWKLFSERSLPHRHALGTTLKMGPREVQAVDEMEQVMTDLLGPTGPAAMDELATFVNSTMVNQLRNTPNPYGDPARFKHIRWFAEHAREVYADFRQPDAASILHSFVRGYMFNKHVGVSWAVAKKTWNQVRNWKDSDGRRPLEPLAEFFLDWMDVVYRGHDKGRDFALSLVMGITKAVGVPFTRYEASRFINGGLNTMHRSFLGWRVAPLVRDSIQPLLAVPRVGPSYVARAYKEAAQNLSNKAALQAIFDRMADFGVLQRGIPPIEISAASEANMGMMAGPTRFSPAEERNRLFFQKIGDWARDRMHPQLRHMQSTKLDPLWAYTNLGAWNRVVTGHAAWLRASEAWDAWATGRLASGATPMDLLKEVNGHTFQPAIQRRLLDHITAGDRDLFERVYTNQVVDETQFRYGTREAPPAFRTNTMKVGVQFGNFSLQLLANFRNGMKYGDWKYRAKWLAWVGGVTMLLKEAEEQTGWPFGRFAWSGALSYRGGPGVAAAEATFDWLQGMTDLSQGVEGSPEAVQAQRGFLLPAAVGTAKAFNPFQGAIATPAGLLQALYSPNPVESSLEFLITGDRRSAGTPYDRQWNEPGPTPIPENMGPPVYWEPQ